MDTNRFHNPKYKRQINAARGHKRQPRRFNPGTLKTAGLIAAVLVFLCALAYLIYFASFMMLNTVTVANANQLVEGQVRDEFNAYRNSYILKVFPRKNILFFNKRGFAKNVLDHTFEIAEVKSVKKHFNGTVAMDVVQRVPAYVLETPSKKFILNSDGNISSEAREDQLGSFLHIRDLQEDDLQSGQRMYDLDIMKIYETVRTDFPKYISMPVNSYEIPARNSISMVALAGPDNIRFLFSLKSDPSESLTKLFTLWTNLPADQLKRLYYIDMRYPTNAYVCLKGDPCAAIPVIQAQ